MTENPKWKLCYNQYYNSYSIVEDCPVEWQIVGVIDERIGKQIVEKHNAAIDAMEWWGK